MSIYDDLMRFKPDGMSPNGWAVHAGVSRTVWADMKRHDNPSRRTLEKLLAVAGSSLAEFEALRIGDAENPRQQDPVDAVGDIGAPGWRGAPLPPIPVFWTAVSSARCGDCTIDCLLIDRSRRTASVARPLSLARDQTAFAVATLDNRMWPRFRPGRHIIVSALAPVAIGDDVLVTLVQTNESRELSIVGELARRSAEAAELRQFNPADTIHIDGAEIGAIAKIVGEAY